MPHCPRPFVLTTALLIVVWCLQPASAHPSLEDEGSGQASSHSPRGDSRSESAGASQVQITVRNGYRYITSNGIPDHETGRFPNRGNPNRISAQDHSFRVPVEPTPAAGSRSRQPKLFGVALNGVPFEPGTAEVWTPQGRGQGRGEWRYEALTGNINLGLDQHNAHVQPTGMYHYHALPVGLYERLAGGSVNQVPRQMVLLGWAADGYPIYGVYAHETADDADSPLIRMTSGYKVREGRRPTDSDSPGGAYDGTYTKDWVYDASLNAHLDEYNGRVGVTPEFPDGTFYYVLTEDYPFVPRRLKGVADSSFQSRGGGPGQERRGSRSNDSREDRPARGDRPPPRR